MDEILINDKQHGFIRFGKENLGGFKIFSFAHLVFYSKWKFYNILNCPHTNGLCLTLHPY